MTDDTPTQTDSGYGEPSQEGFYCPGCGRRVEYRQRCTGKPDAPHPPIEVVPVSELAHAHDVDAQPGEPGYHTPAPRSDNLG